MRRSIILNSSKLRPYVDGTVTRSIGTKTRSKKPSEYTQRCVLRTLGQPVPSTHPHLLSVGELLPGLKVEEFKTRRNNLMKLIVEDVVKKYGKTMPVVIIVPSATKAYMSGKIPYVFRQNSDFLYLSGCLEPDTALILSGRTAESYNSTILLRPHDQNALLWDGPRTGVEDAIQLFGVDEAGTTDEFSNHLSKIADEYSEHLLFYDSPNFFGLPYHNTISSHIQKRGITFSRAATYLHQLRVIKSRAEQELMRKAGEISSASINRTIQITRTGLSEHQLFATVDYESRMRGAETLAYVPVVATGTNANIIHYIENKQMLSEGELLLMDAGCEYHGYCGDISRTWPVSGKFNTYQRILYEIVLEVQLKLISLCEERMSLDELHKTMVHLLGLYLSNEKILKHNISSSNELLLLAHELCPHHCSHYLGMDVHDVPTMPKNVPLQAGMVLTIEPVTIFYPPGLYISNRNTKIASEFQNMGIRIEDDVLITNTGFEVLSKNCSKTVNDIENLMLSGTNLVT